MTQRTRPPFRADQVGSFLRPERLKEARAKRDKGEITAAQLKAVEDEEIKKVIKQQEDVGMQLATDGEFRRTFWHFDFLGGMTGIDLYDHSQGIQFQGAETKAWDIRTVGKYLRIYTDMPASKRNSKAAIDLCKRGMEYLVQEVGDRNPVVFVQAQFGENGNPVLANILGGSDRSCRFTYPAPGK